MTYSHTLAQQIRQAAAKKYGCCLLDVCQYIFVHVCVCAEARGLKLPGASTFVTCSVNLPRWQAAAYSPTCCCAMAVCRHREVTHNNSSCSRPPFQEASKPFECKVVLICGCRFFTYLLVLFLTNLASNALFRGCAAVGRDPIVSSTVGVLAMYSVVFSGGIMLGRSKSAGPY